MTFGAVIVEISNKHSLSLQRFADGVNAVYADPRDRISKMTVSNWANHAPPPLSKIDYLARYAPEGSWVREFAVRGCAALKITDKVEGT